MIQNCVVFPDIDKWRNTCDAGQKYIYFFDIVESIS